MLKKTKATFHGTGKYVSKADLERILQNLPDNAGLEFLVHNAAPANRAQDPDEWTLGFVYEEDVA